MTDAMAALLRKVLAMWGFILALPTLAADLTLEEFVAQVLRQNPTLEAAQARAAALGYRVDPASTLDDPFFAAGPDDVVINGSGHMLRYQLNQTLPFPGKLEARGGLARARASAAEYDAETTRRQLVVFATQAYYSAYFNQRAIELNTETRNLLLPQVETSRARYMTSGSSHHEWLLGKAQLGILNTDRLRLKRDGVTLNAVLNELRTLEPKVPLGTLRVQFSDVEAPEPPASIEQQPEVLALGQLAAASDEEAKLARLAYFPDFMVQGMYSDRDGMNERSTWGIMVGINLPIFSYRKQANLVRAAERDRVVALAERSAIQNRLRAELKEAEQEFQTAKDIVRLYETSVIPETKLALASVRESYTAGTAPLTGVLNLAMIRLTQELELLGARIDVELALLRRRELLSSPPIKRFAPEVPTIFSTESMGGPIGSMSGTMRGSGGSATGMGQGGMSGPAARPNDMGVEVEEGMGGM